MDDRARRFRRAVERRNDRGALRRSFDPELRAQAVAYCRDRRVAGASWAAVSEELEVSASLLQKWCSATGGSFARVEVVEDAASGSRGDQPIRLITAQGHEVSGLSVEQTAELLRLLS